MSVTLFYDGHCPLCLMEMRHLARVDRDNKLKFEDIQRADFSIRYPQLDWHELNARIHVLTEDGQWLTGLDATHLVWKTVGRGWLYAPTRWPLIKPLADAAYNWFARNRYGISSILTGKSRCQSGCAIAVKQRSGDE